MIKKLIEFIYLKQDGNLAYYDILTGVKNRTYYDRVIRQKYCIKDCYVTYIDVDNLKSINDRFGHHAGDTLIRGVANQLKRINSADKEICRIGGDEFILISKEYIDIKLKGASVGIYHKCKYEDISSSVSKADKECQRNKNRSE